MDVDNAHGSRWASLSASRFHEERSGDVNSKKLPPPLLFLPLCDGQKTEQRHGVEAGVNNHRPPPSLVSWPAATKEELRRWQSTCPVIGSERSPGALSGAFRWSRAAATISLSVRATKVVAGGVRSRRACDGVLLSVATRRSRAGGADRRSFLFRLPPPLGGDGTRRRFSRLRAASPFQRAKPSDLPSLGRRRWHESTAIRQ
nr:hypothetical protein Itr_chr15CG14110 [Ipomoea trifida]